MSETKTPRTDEYEELMLILKMAEAVVPDPRHKSTFRRSRERIAQLETELAAEQQARVAAERERQFDNEAWARDNARLKSAEARARAAERERDEAQALSASRNIRATLAEDRAERAEARAQEMETDLLHAASVGMSILLTRFGAYESLSPYLKGKWDELSALHAKCEGAFNRNRDAAQRKEGV